MSSAGVSPSRNTVFQPIAPFWHTVLVLLPIAIGSVASAYQHGLPTVNLHGLSQRLSSYVTVLFEEWLGVFLVWLALRHKGRSLGSLVAGRWQTFGAFFKDLGVVIGFVVIVVPLAGGLAYVLGANDNAAVANLTPKTLSELLVFLVLAASAGFGEELVFRGYLTAQFTAWTGRALFGIALQGIVFGLAHGFYRKAMIAIYGARLASWTARPLAQEPTSRDAGTLAARHYRRRGRVFFVNSLSWLGVEPSL